MSINYPPLKRNIWHTFGIVTPLRGQALTCEGLSLHWEFSVTQAGRSGAAGRGAVSNFLTLQLGACWDQSVPKSEQDDDHG